MTEKVDEHPEDVRPLGESHTHLGVGERRAVRFLTIGLFVGILLVPFVSVVSSSGMTNVFLGLSPMFLTFALQIGVVSSHFKRHVLWFLLIVLHMVGLAYLWMINPLLTSSINVGAAVSTSLLFSFVFTWLAFTADVVSAPKKTYRMPPPVEFTPEKLPEFVQSIEDKAKALNFAIGRVYRNSNGGSATLRERLRIPRDWYNEFHEAEEAERVKKAKVIIKKIHDRLLMYEEPEKDVFSPQERKKFKNMQRKEDGTSKVVDVLKKNDSDPVEHIYQQAVDFCDQVLQGLG